MTWGYNRCLCCRACREGAAHVVVVGLGAELALVEPSARLVPPLAVDALLGPDIRVVAPVGQELDAVLRGPPAVVADLEATGAYRHRRSFVPIHLVAEQG